MDRETRRQEYLREMGIQAYFPRYRLPAAAPSPQYPALSDALHVEATASPQGGAESKADPVPQAVTEPSAADAAMELLNSTGQAPGAGEPRAAQLVEARVESPQSAPVAREADREKESGGIEPFAFVWFSPDPRLAILASLPEGRREGLSREAHRLLNNILAAVDPVYAEKPMQAFAFAWPFDPADDSRAPVSAAAQAVQGFIRRRLKARSASHLLVLADEWPVWLPPADTSMVVRGLVEHPVPGLKLLRIPSLHAMQADRSLKKPAWQRLQYLIRSLSTEPGGTSPP